MPIEIKELHIRVAVNTLSREPRVDSVNFSSSFGGNTADNEGKDILVAECVEQVLEILRHKNER